MNPELEKTVNSVLANGEVSDRSRELLMKKAEQLGIDLLDFELELESKIAQQKSNQKNQNNNITNNLTQNSKLGDIKKCPECGSVVESFNTKCKDCGHEFRNVGINSSVKRFSEQLLVIDIDARDDYYKNGRDKTVIPKGPLSSEKIFQKSTQVIELEIEASAIERKINLICSFPVPNSKEEILEFLVLCIPLASKKLGFWDKVQQSKTKLKKAWLSKAEEIIMRARFSMKEDPKTLAEINEYAKQLDFK